MVTLCVLALAQDVVPATEIRTALTKLEASYTFQAETAVEGMKPDVEIAAAEGSYQRKVGVLTKLPELSVVKNGKKVAYERKGGAWTAFKKAPGAARPDKVPDAPHQELGKLVTRTSAGTKAREEGLTVVTVKVDARRAVAWADDFLAMEQVGSTGEATLKLWFDDKGVPTRYEAIGSGKAVNGSDYKIVRKVKLTEVGTAKVELPEAARAALAAP